MSIEDIKFGLGSIKPLPAHLKPEKPLTQKSEGGTSFGSMLGNAMKDLNSLQVEADKQIEGLMLEKPGINTHDAMIALERADIAFQLMNQVRSRIVRAYEEVMRTQV